MHWDTFSIFPHVLLPMADSTAQTSHASCSMDMPSDLEEPKPPADWPEGGTRAWLVVAGGFCVSFSTFGYSNAYGYGCPVLDG